MALTVNGKSTLFEEEGDPSHFHIFRSGGASGTKDIAGGDAATRDDPSGQAMNISLRGLNRSALVKAGKTRSLADLKKTVQRHAKVRPRTRGPVEPGDNPVEGEIQNDAVPNPVLVQTIIVRYYKPKGQ